MKEKGRDGVTLFKRILQCFDMIVNYGISPLTILRNRRRLKLASRKKGVKDEDEHGV